MHLYFHVRLLISAVSNIQDLVMHLFGWRCISAVLTMQSSLYRISADGDLGAALRDGTCWRGLEQSMLAFRKSMQKLISALLKPAAGEAILSGVLAHLSLNGYYTQ